MPLFIHFSFHPIIFFNSQKFNLIILITRKLADCQLTDSFLDKTRPNHPIQILADFLLPSPLSDTRIIRETGVVSRNAINGDTRRNAEREGRKEGRKEGIGRGHGVHRTKGETEAYIIQAAAAADYADPH